MRNLLVIDDEYPSLEALRQMLDPDEYTIFPSNETENKKFMVNVIAALKMDNKISSQEGIHYLNKYINTNEIMSQKFALNNFMTLFAFIY